jgi:hypothetical protein
MAEIRGSGLAKIMRKYKSGLLLDCDPEAQIVIPGKARDLLLPLTL